MWWAWNSRGQMDPELVRLEASIERIEALRKIFKSASFAIGVIHGGETIFTKGFGHSNVERLRKPDEETIYSIGSCTKSFTAACVSLMVDRGQLTWDRPVSCYVPDFETPYDPVVGQTAVLSDLLSHSTGLAALIYAVIGKNFSGFVKHRDVVHISSRLPRVSTFRTEWQYNNWPFGLISNLISKVSESPWQDHVHEIFRVLGLGRTVTTCPPDDNYARSYIVHDDGSSVQIPIPTMIGGDAFDSSGAIRSCVKDMLKWSRIILKACHANDSDEKAEPSSTADLTEGDIIHAVNHITRPRFPLNQNPEQSYAMGLFSFQLPSEEFSTVTNATLIKTPFKIGKESGSRRAVGHTGESGGFCSVFWTFPETNSAVVVLTNSSAANGDATHIVAQELIQALFDLQPKVNFTSVAEEIVMNAEIQWNNCVASWSANRIPDTAAGPTASYLGVYCNEDMCMRLTITRADSPKESSNAAQLVLRINDLEEQTFEMYHYHHATWTFMPSSREECLRNLTYLHIARWDSFLVGFQELNRGRYDQLSWLLGSDTRVGAHVFQRVE